MSGHSNTLKNSDKFACICYHRPKNVVFGRFLRKLATFRRFAGPSTFNLELFNVDFRDQRIESNLKTPGIHYFSKKVDFVVGLI